MRKLRNYHKYLTDRFIQKYTLEELFELEKKQLLIELPSCEKFFIGVEKNPESKDEHPVFMKSGETSEIMYAALSELSARNAERKLKKENVVFVPITKEQFLHIAEIGKKSLSLNMVFTIGKLDFKVSGAEVFDAMNEGPSKEKTLSWKISHYLTRQCRLNIFFLLAIAFLFLFPNINRHFLPETGIAKTDEFHLEQKCYARYVIKRFRGNEADFVISENDLDYSGTYCLGVKCFSGKENLVSVDLEQCRNLVNIHRYAFSECPKLKTIILPDGVEKIYSYAFYKLDSLEELFIPQGVKDLSDGFIIYGCPNLKKIHVSKKLYSAYESDFEKYREQNPSVEYVFSK